VIPISSPEGQKHSFDFAALQEHMSHEAIGLIVAQELKQDGYTLVGGIDIVSKRSLQFLSVKSPAKPLAISARWVPNLCDSCNDIRIG
jgi:hypothetical protein